MENASKALLMAGGMLLAMLVLVLLVFMFNNLTGYFSEDTQANREAQIAKFNQEYESYNREDVRGTDMLSLLAKVQDYNTSQSDYRGVGAGYLPMTVIVYIKNDKNEIENDFDEFKYDTKDRQQINGMYTQSQFQDGYSSITKIKKDCIKELSKMNSKNRIVTENDLETLTSAITIICDEIDTTNYVRAEVQREKRYQILKRAFSFDTDLENFETSWWNSNKVNVRTQIKKYYQYTQFKKAYFYCSSNGNKNSSGVEYDKNTGRITKLTFYFDYIGE